MNTFTPPMNSFQFGKSDDAASAPSVDAVIQSTLGKKLRESYQQVVNEEVPARFLDLLEQLKVKERGDSGEERS